MKKKEYQNKSIIHGLIDNICLLFIQITNVFENFLAHVHVDQPSTAQFDVSTGAR